MYELLGFEAPNIFFVVSGQNSEMRTTQVRKRRRAAAAEEDGGNASAVVATATTPADTAKTPRTTPKQVRRRQGRGTTPGGRSGSGGSVTLVPSEGCAALLAQLPPLPPVAAAVAVAGGDANSSAMKASRDDASSVASSSGKWSALEDELLSRAVAEAGPRHWRQVRAHACVYTLAWTSCEGILAGSPSVFHAPCERSVWAPCAVAALLTSLLTSHVPAHPSIDVPSFASFLSAFPSDLGGLLGRAPLRCAMLAPLAEGAEAWARQGAVDAGGRRRHRRHARARGVQVEVRGVVVALPPPCMLHAVAF